MVVAVAVAEAVAAVVVAVGALGGAGGGGDGECATAWASGVGTDALVGAGVDGDDSVGSGDATRSCGVAGMAVGTGSARTGRANGRRGSWTGWNIAEGSGGGAPRRACEI